MARIFFISTLEASPWGGCEELWSRAAETLVVAGHDITISVKWWPKAIEFLSHLEKNGAIVYYRKIKIRHRFQNKVNQRYFDNTIPVEVAEHFNKIIRLKPDLVCISQGGSICGIAWMLLCHRHKIPYVCISQANYEEWWPNDSQLGVCNIAYENAIKSYFVSNANLDLMERQLARKLTNAEVISNPFNVPWDQQFEWPSTDSGLSLACVARLDPRSKGQDLILAALASEKWRSRNLTINFYGSGDFRNSLQALATSLQVNSNVKIGHFEADVSSIWKNNHGLILSSRYEGLPLVILEAMLCGRFVITTNVAGNTEHLIDEETAFIARSTTVQDVENALERAWNKRQQWKEMGALAFSTIRKRIPASPSDVLAEKLMSFVI